MANTPSLISTTHYDTSAGWLDFGNESSHSATVSCISNSNRAAIIHVQGGGARTVTSATLGGQSLSRIGYIAYPSSIFMDVWGIMNAPTGNQTLTVNLSGATSGSFEFSQFADVGLIRNQVTTQYGSNNAPSTVATNLIKDDLVVSSIVKYNDLTGVGAGQTEITYYYRWSLYTRPSYKVPTSDGSSTFSYTASTNDKWAHVIWSLAPLPTGGGQVIWWN